MSNSSNKFGPNHSPDVLQNIDNEEEFVEVANSDISQLCGELVLLWDSFLQAVSRRETIRKHLAKINHFQRVRAGDWALLEKCQKLSFHPFFTFFSLRSNVSQRPFSPPITRAIRYEQLVLPSIVKDVP